MHIQLKKLISQKIRAPETMDPMGIQSQPIKGLTLNLFERLQIYS